MKKFVLIATINNMDIATIVTSPDIYKALKKLKQRWEKKYPIDKNGYDLEIQAAKIIPIINLTDKEE